MASRSDTYVVGATLIPVGLSQVIRLTPTPNLYSSALKIGAGGGTLEIVPPQLSGTSTAAGNAWGKGYMLGASEVMTWAGPAVVYLAATGATMVAALTLGYSEGATML